MCEVFTSDQSSPQKNSQQWKKIWADSTIKFQQKSWTLPLGTYNKGTALSLISRKLDNQSRRLGNMVCIWETPGWWGRDGESGQDTNLEIYFVLHLLHPLLPFPPHMLYFQFVPLELDISSQILLDSGHQSQQKRIQTVLWVGNTESK